MEEPCFHVAVESDDEGVGAQAPPLTEEIAGILRRYPDGGQILKVGVWGH